MKLRYTLRQLEYFIAAGEAGSIIEAAKAISISSASISAAISQLEAELGVTLFIRQHAQGLSLTTGGQRIFNEAKRIMDQAHALTDLAGDISSIPRGTISLGCLVTLAPMVSASIRRSFEAIYPEAKVSVKTAHQADLLAMLGRAEIDLAITYNLDIPSDIAFTGMIELPPYVMVSASHPLAGMSSVALATLAGEPMVLLDLPFSREYFLAMFHEQGLRPKIAERSPDPAVMRSLVANGFGYGLMNIHPASALAPDGEELAFLEIEQTPRPPRPMVLGTARKKGSLAPRIVEAFAEHLQQRVDQNTLPGLEPAPTRT
ncbi:LysR substrate-binding domain-containing protein [Alphaproteobacteria bacterium LSUCC0684]